MLKSSIWSHLAGLDIDLPKNSSIDIYTCIYRERFTYRIYRDTDTVILRKPVMDLVEFLGSFDWEHESFPKYEDFAVLPLFALFFPTVRFFLDIFIFEVPCWFYYMFDWSGFLYFLLMFTLFDNWLLDRLIKLTVCTFCYSLLYEYMVYRWPILHSSLFF